jgi:hypothetical protein
MENDLKRYDYLTNAFSLQPYKLFEKVMVAFPAQYSHSIVHGKNYLSSVNVGNVNNIRLTDSLMAQLGAFYQYDDFLRPPYGDESRTGNTLTGTVGGFWFFAKHEGFTSLKYSCDQDWTHGSNWEYFGNRVDLGLLVPFRERFKLGGNGQIFLKDFANAHSVLGQERSDQSYALSSFVSYEFIKNTELQFQYTYINNQSNLSLYEYTRHVLSWAVQYKY